MAGLFSRSKKDMGYLFKDGNSLNKKQKKRKKRAWLTLIGLLFVLIQIVFTVLFLLNLFKLDLLPIRYLIAVNAILILIALYDFTAQFTKAHIIGKLLAIVLSVALVFSYLMTAKIDLVLKKITKPVVNTDVIEVIVMKDDKASTIKDTTNYTYGYNSGVATNNVLKAFNNINSDYNVKSKTLAYTNWHNLIEALYSGENIQAIVISKAMESIISQEDETFFDKVKVVGSYKYSELVNVEASKVDVDSEPFIIYVSGISSDDGADSTLASRALSDVNILCVVNPNTRQVLLVTTPRDSYVKITNDDGYTGLDKLTHAGNYGIEKSIDALENLYGVNIDYYVKINFTGCEAVVDALGGITIDSEVEFTNGEDAAPVSYHFVKGLNECDGAKTIAFTRERHAFPTGDFQRGRNQTAAIKAIIQKATSPAILTKYSAVLDAVSDMFLTNIPNEAISDLVKAQLNDTRAWTIQSYSIEGICEYRNLQVTGIMGASCVIPNTTDINMAIQLMSKISNGDVFVVDEYIESVNSPQTSTIH